MQQSSTSNYTSPYSHKQAAAGGAGGSVTNSNSGGAAVAPKNIH